MTDNFITSTTTNFHFDPEYGSANYLYTLGGDRPIKITAQPLPCSCGYCRESMFTERGPSDAEIIDTIVSIRKAMGQVPDAD